jgi:hypothetical protein
MVCMRESSQQPASAITISASLGLTSCSWCWLQYGGKRLADVVEALLGAAYLTAATAAAADGDNAALQGGAAQRLSDEGLSAAAELCELLGLLPQGEGVASPPLLNTCRHAPAGPGGCPWLSRHCTCVC